MIKIYYRYTDSVNQAIRPRWFSKDLCLKSFLRSYLATEKIIGRKISLTFCIDAPPGLNNRPTVAVEKMIKLVGGSIKYLGGIGNSNAYRFLLAMAKKDPDRSFLIFAEDDYLWMEDALIKLYCAAQEVKADYYTPYDHPVRYNSNFAGGADVPHWNTNILCSSDGTHFRSHESTCMTFGVRAKTLKRDMVFHRRFTKVSNKPPQDRELFRCLQKLGRYSRRQGLRRLLVGPMPSLATHCHDPYLAPGINWSLLARKTQTWQIPY